MSLPSPTHDTVRARAARAVTPNSGWCGRCGLPWAFVEGHSTAHGDFGSVFPLCESCWAILGDSEARWPYYQALLDVYAQNGHPLPDDQAANLRANVRSGL